MGVSSAQRGLPLPLPLVAGSPKRRKEGMEKRDEMEARISKEAWSEGSWDQRMRDEGKEMDDKGMIIGLDGRKKKRDYQSSKRATETIPL